MSANSSRPRRRVGCLGRLVIFVLFMGACYWLLLAPIKERGTDQTQETSTLEAPAEHVSIEGEVNATQQAVLEEIADETGEHVDVLAQNGQIQYLTVNVKVPDSVAVSAQEKASYFIQENRNLFQVDNPGREFKAKARSKDEIGTTFIRYEQEFKGIPIYGSQAVIEVSKGGEIESVIAGYSPNLAIDVQPAIRSTEAEEIALKDLGDPNGQFLIPSRLVIYDPKLFEEATPSAPKLAWDVVVASLVELSVRTYLVDAQTGHVLISLEEIIGVRERRVWDVEEKTIDNTDAITKFVSVEIIVNFSKLVMNEKGPIPGTTPDDDAERAWLHAGTVYDYYYNNFKRDSLDGAGEPIDLYVNIRNCRGSFWVPIINEPMFCNNSTSLDAITHELTHGVWLSWSVRTFYKDEALALNESFSDIFAAFIDDTDPWRIIGDNPTPDNPEPEVIRNLADPASRGDFTHYSQYIQNANERQKYQNSTIHTYAVYLLSEGTRGTPINGIEVTGIGRTKAQYIYYDVMANRLIIRANFNEARRAAIASCKKLISKHDIVSSDCDQIMNAYAAVGIGDPAIQPSSPPISLPELPSNWLDTLRVYLRRLVDNALGDWNPLKLGQQIQAEIEKIRNNYWVKLLECIKNSDQACVEKYWADLLNAILEMILKEFSNFCSGLFLFPATVLVVAAQRKLRR